VDAPEAIGGHGMDTLHYGIHDAIDEWPARRIVERPPVWGTLALTSSPLPHDGIGGP